MEQANLPSQADLNSLYGAWNPMSYMQGQQNQDLAQQFRDQAFQGNQNTLMRDAMANDQAAQMNPMLLEGKRQDITRTGLLNDQSAIENQSAGLKLDTNQQLHQEQLAAAREELRSKLSDAQYSQLGNKILQDHMDAIRGGDPATIEKTSMLLDLVGGKVGGAVAKTIQKRNLTEGQWVSNQNIANTKADATVGAAALRPSAAAKAPTDPYIAWNKLGSDARSSRIQGALTSGMNPVTHEPMTDAEREAFKAELAQASRNLDQKSNNLNQGVTADIDPATGKIRIVKKQTPSVSGVSKLSDDDLINKYLPKK